MAVVSPAMTTSPMIRARRPSLTGARTTSSASASEATFTPIVASAIAVPVRIRLAVAGSRCGPRWRRLRTQVAPTTIGRKMAEYETTMSHGSLPKGDAARTVPIWVVTTYRIAQATTAKAAALAARRVALVDESRRSVTCALSPRA